MPEFDLIARYFAPLATNAAPAGSGVTPVPLPRAAAKVPLLNGKPMLPAEPVRAGFGRKGVAGR